MSFRNKWFRQVFHRRMLICLLIVLQAAFMVWLIVSGSQFSVSLGRLLKLLSILAVLYIVSHRNKGAYKTLWVFLILCFPIFGGLLFLMVNVQTPTRKMRNQVARAHEKAEPFYTLPEDAYEVAKDATGTHFPQVRYLQNYAGFPVYDHTQTRYFCPGEAMLEELLVQLEKAEHYIFLEYFIVGEGECWNRILEVLKRKAAQGVKVRLIFDDLGCFFTIPNHYDRYLSRFGIECAVFNPFKPVLTVKQNNRDHRKIVSIDGKVAFTGGINLADEYFNVYEKYGHWKDSAVMVEGKAAWSFTLIFLEMWQVCRHADEDYAVFYPWKDGPCQVPSDGFVQPYADSPMDTENVGEHVYLQIINEAKDYVYINTPYLILDDSMISALCLAAKRGVDVRIVTPHKWDKLLVHLTTRSYYRELIQSGVKVYEYTEGFIHAKSFVCDDVIATNGTANMDYRSLYLHFECGTWLYGGRAVMETKQDFLETLPLCQTVSEADCSRNPFMILLQESLRLLAPLM